MAEPHFESMVSAHLAFADDGSEAEDTKDGGSTDSHSIGKDAGHMEDEHDCKRDRARDGRSCDEHKDSEAVRDRYPLNMEGVHLAPLAREE